MSFELIFVDDGSQDGTLERLHEIADSDARVTVVELRRNFGQTAALSAGLAQACGEIVVTIDGDLQNDPRDIPLLVAEVRAGSDLVTGWRRDRQDPWLTRRLPSQVANWVLRKLLGVPLHDTGCSLKAFRRDLVEQLPLYADLHRLIPAISTPITTRICEVVVRHHPRRAGSSKYGLSRIWRVCLDLLAVKMLVSFSQRPLRWFAFLSIPVIAAAVALMFFSLLATATYQPTQPLITWDISFLLLYLAAHLVFSGIFAELVVMDDIGLRPRALCQTHIMGGKSVDRVR